MNCIPLLLVFAFATPSTEVVAPPTPTALAGQSDVAAVRAQPPVDIVELPGGSKPNGGSLPSSPSTETVARALEPAEGSALTGHPLLLSDALAVVRNTDGQQAVVHAYWNAVAMVARYNLRSRGRTILDRLDPRPGDELAIRAARGSAAAAVDEAQIAAIAAQHELAQKAFLPLAADELPLPSDQPCAGPYETRYELLFANRPAPSQAWLIHRTLPLRQTAVDHRAGAVEAAAGHLAASQAAYRLGSVGLENVLAALSSCIQEENAFMRSVCDYNHDIADYATAVLVGPTDSATLVSMLIGRRPGPAGEQVAPLGGVISTGSPIPTMLPPSSGVMPTLAPPEGAVQPASAVQPIAPVETPANPGGRAASGDVTGPRQLLDDDLPGILPANEPLVPIEPRGQAAPAEGSSTGQPAEGEAPKLQVVPAETPTAPQT